VLVLIALILFGVGVAAVAGTVLLLRSAPTIKARRQQMLAIARDRLG
jgi:hypothetical protein